MIASEKGLLEFSQVWRTTQFISLAFYLEMVLLLRFEGVLIGPRPPKMVGSLVVPLLSDKEKV